MNVLLISECTKKALTETRRILDQFAERRGERTWQTPITQQGLDTLRKLLRKTARKNTAVACHWIRGVDHTELLWIVGDASRFSAQGAVPTNTTTRNVLRRHDENDWHTGEDISLLAQMAALLHDLGKASVAFQGRLKSPVRESSLYRHEWVSLRIFAAFVGTDDDKGWLTRMVASSGDTDWLESSRYLRDGLDTAPPPLERLPPLAAAIGWLIVTHHRLPAMPVFDQDSHKQQFLGARVPHFVPAAQLDDLFRQVQHSWNERLTEAEAKVIEPYWTFEHGLPVVLPKWRSRAAKIALRMLALADKPAREDWLGNPYVMHLARLSLMLADHHYSALGFDAVERVAGDSDPRAPTTLFANTGIDKDKQIRRKQTLDEHLLGVARDVGAIVHALPGFERNLPRLVRHRGLRKRTDKQRFLWQNKAADVADSMRARAAEQGAFIVNMASTGCGKTLANARMMNALADPQQGMRCSFALGLRTLTLQTGRSYRNDLNLGDDDLAILTGGSASRALFEYYEKLAEQSGSASVQDLLTEDSHVIYDGLYAENGLLDKAMKDPKIHALLSAPVLVCTIDHLMPATEAQRAGRQIAPMLRLMSADLVLDELDDFDIDDLPAVTRLVHWAGLLGSRVLISSATLPPSLVEGLYQAYRTGRSHYRRNRGRPDGRSDARPEVACLWVDEFDARAMACVDVDAFRSAHAQFVQYRVGRLAEQPPRRRGVLLSLKMVAKDETAIRREFAAEVLDAAVQAHAAHHEICPVSGKRVSFGLVRMANIEPLFDVALELFRLGAPENHHVHLCVYHSRFPLLLRSAIEHRLDTVLNRRDKDAVYALPEVRQAIDAHSEENHLFVVLGSPVTEVGRDHDYDWAVVEPSSMRSLIQLAGRVLRHRQEEPASPNVFIFDTNLKHFTSGRSTDGQRRAAFVRPGFEDTSLDISSPFRLISHSLRSLLREDEYTTITARPRVEPAPQPAWRPKESLVDLEHARLHQMMTPKDRASAARVRGQRPAARDLDAACAWQYPHAMLTWVLPQQQRFRDDGMAKEKELVFLPDEDGERLLVHRIEEQTKDGRADIYILDDHKVERINLVKSLGPRISRWGQDDLLALVAAQAEERGLSLYDTARRFATVTVPQSAQGWRYHEGLGFSKK